VLLIGVNITGFAQGNSLKEMPLSKVLLILENNYGVSFSYEDKTISGKKMILPKKGISLLEALTLIEKNTDVVFERLNNRFIVVKNNIRTPFLFEDLKEVAITGYLTTGIHKNLDGTIKIETEELGVLPGLIEPDVLQIVNAMPGVFSVSESVSSLNIRGGTHDQNLILFDGIRMYETGHFFGLISAFHPNLQPSITLSKSGSHPKYGEGISSVVDIALPNTITNDGLKFGVGVNLLNIDFTSTIPITKNAALQLAGRRAVTDFLNTPTYNKYFARAFQDSDLDRIKENNSIISKEENFKFYDLYGKFIWNLSKNDQLKIVFLNIDNDLSYQESLIEVDERSALTSKLNQNTITTGVTYEKRWTDKFVTNIHGYYTNYELFSNNADILNEQNLVQENRVEDNGFKLAVDYKFTKKATLSSGYQFSQIAVSNLEDVDNPLYRRYVKEVIITNSIYSALSYAYKAMAFQAGFRANHFSKLNRLIVEPRLTFNYKIDKNFSVAITGDLKSQSISQIIDLQNDFLGVEKKRWVLANNNDKPLITSKQIEVGFYYKKNNFLMSSEAYVKDVDGISSRSQGFQNQFQYEKDVGGYQVKGIDFLIHKKINKLRAWLSYSFMINDYTFEYLNNSEKFPNTIEVTNVVDLSGTYTYKNFDIGLGLNWHSGSPFTTAIGLNSLGTEIEYESPNSSRQKDFLRLDSSCNYRFNIGKSSAKIGVSVWNLLNRANVLNTYYDIYNDEVSKIENISLGITPNFSFSVAF